MRGAHRGAEESCRRDRPLPGFRVPEGMGALTGVHEYRLVAVPGAKPSKNQRMSYHFAPISFVVIHPHFRAGGEAFDWPKALNRTDQTVNGLDRKQSGRCEAKTGAGPSDLGHTETGGLASSRGCYSNHRSLMILSTYEDSEKLNAIEAMVCARCAHRPRRRMRNIGRPRARRSGKGGARLQCGERGDTARDGAQGPSLVREDDAWLVRRNLVHAPRPGGPV